MNWKDRQLVPLDGFRGRRDEPQVFEESFAPMTVHFRSGGRYAAASRLDEVAFWNPLPPAEELPAETRRIIREADTDIKRGRLNSALDYSLLVNALAPSFLPGFVRTAELLIACKRRDQALTLAQSIARQAKIEGGQNIDLQLSKILAHAVPDPENTLRIARQVLDDNARHLHIPYIPAAISALVHERLNDNALDLAAEWCEQSPRSPVALAYLVREQLRAGDFGAASQILDSFRRENDADKIWPAHPIASAVVALADPSSARWIAIQPACELLRKRRLALEEAKSIADFLSEPVEELRRIQIAVALFELNAGNTNESLISLRTIQPETNAERFLIANGVACSSAADPAGRKSRFSALADAFNALRDRETISLADQGQHIFDPPANVRSIGLELVNALRENQSHSNALKVLNRLQELGYSDSDTERLKAEIIGQSGSKNQAINELDRLLKTQEEERNHVAAIKTLESMVTLLPTNTMIRNRLVDKYLRVGEFHKAINHLKTLGRILHREQRINDAMQPIYRAIEIAGMISDWDNVDSLHQLMIGFAPEDTGIRHSAVATFVQLGRTEKAMEHLRVIAEMARDREDPDEAIAALHQMLALSPEDTSTYHRLGEVLVSIGEYGQAERVYRRLEALKPDDLSVSAKRSALAALAKSRS